MMALNSLFVKIKKNFHVIFLLSELEPCTNTVAHLEKNYASASLIEEIRLKTQERLKAQEDMHSH